MSPNYSERPPTDEEQQRLAHLSDICFKGFGIRLLSASGPPGIFSVGKDGDEVQLANFAPFITKGAHHRSLDRFEDSVDLLCIPSDQRKNAILLHDVCLHELSIDAKARRISTMKPTLLGITRLTYRSRGQRSPGASFNSLEVSHSKSVSSVPSRPI